MFSNDNKITLIVPVYNAQRTIDSCIESIISQTFSSWELIIVNDGSTDSSLELCLKWAKTDNRITIYSQENSGAGVARNFGIAKCQTRWLTFVDADDKLSIDYLDNFHIENLQKGDISVQGYVRLTPEGKYIGESKNFSSHYYNKDCISQAFQNENLLDYGQTVGKLYETEMIQNNNCKFTAKFRLSEDHLFFLSLLPFVNGILTNPGEKYYYLEWYSNTNVTRQKIPAAEAICRFKALKDAYSILLRTFHIDKNTHTWLQDFIFTNGQSLIIQGLFKDTAKTDAKRYLHSLVHKNNDFNLKFRPKSIKGKLMKLMIQNLPIGISYYILKIILNQ